MDAHTKKMLHSVRWDPEAPETPCGTKHRSIDEGPGLFDSDATEKGRERPIPAKEEEDDAGINAAIAGIDAAKAAEAAEAAEKKAAEKADADRHAKAERDPVHTGPDSTTAVDTGRAEPDEPASPDGGVGVGPRFPFTSVLDGDRKVTDTTVPDAPIFGGLRTSYLDAKKPG